ncbi:MAG TPA: hypothetical protein VGH38_10850 [Bryobacteraceae bacterium]
MSDSAGVIAVSEDPFIQKYLGDVLKKHGYRVIGSDPARTIQLIQSGTESIDLVITNSPLDFIPVAQKVALLYIAAVPDPEIGSSFASFMSLKKPFQPNRLLDAVEDLVGTVVR